MIHCCLDCLHKAVLGITTATQSVLFEGHKLKRVALYLTSGLLAVSVGLSAAAQELPPNVTRCLNQSKALALNVQITGCTAALQSAQDTPTLLIRALVYVSRGMAYRATGDYDRAIADFDEALRLDPATTFSSTFVYFSRGEVYAYKKDYDRAIADYSEVIRLNPSIAEVYSNRGIAYERKADYDQAIADFRQALSKNPNHQGSREALERLGAKP
jgi:tetratricopeptide (TPR) repeat protein